MPSDDTPGTPVEVAQGEIFRKQMYDGITPGLALPANPVAEGLGYDFQFPRLNAKQQYTESFGELTSPLLSLDPLNKSF